MLKVHVGMEIVPPVGVVTLLAPTVAARRLNPMAVPFGRMMVSRRRAVELHSATPETPKLFEIAKVE